jgi:RNA polymerase sigma-70 factor (ECF subfamily)
MSPAIDTVPRESAAWPLLQAPRLRRYLRYLGCPHDLADDLVQEAMLLALRNFAGQEPPLPWLCTSARHLFGMHLRQKGRRREIADLDRLHDAWVEQSGPDGGDSALAALRLCLQELPERAALAVELSYRHGLDRKAIGRRLGLRGEGVKSLLARVRAALAVCVRRRLGKGTEPS